MNQILSDAPQAIDHQTTDRDVGDRPPVVEHKRFARPQRVAFVQSSWHREVVEECRIAFLAEIEARGIAPAQIDLFEVPGSFEIPLHAQILAKTRRYTAIKALMDVQLRTEVPIFSAVLTPQQFHESAAHFEFCRKHFAVKGIEVAEACANTLLSLERLRGQVAAGIDVGKAGRRSFPTPRM